MSDALAAHTATKAEAEAHENNLRRDIEASRVELKRDIREVELKLEARIAESKAELTRWIIGAGLLQTTVIGAMLMKMAKLI